MTRRANRKKRLTVLYIVEHPNQEGDTCIDWTSQYCWTNGWNCLWRGHSVYRNRPLIPSVSASPPFPPMFSTFPPVFHHFPPCFPHFPPFPPCFPHFPPFPPCFPHFPHVFHISPMFSCFPLFSGTLTQGAPWAVIFWAWHMAGLLLGLSLYLFGGFPIPPAPEGCLAAASDGGVWTVDSSDLGIG